MLITLITDASHCPDTKACGYGVWVAGQRGKREFSGMFAKPLDNSLLCEMAAIVNGLYHGLKAGLICKGDTILVQTDCTSAIQGFLGSRKISHIEEREILEVYSKLLVSCELFIRFKHVKAHTGKQDKRSISNEVCDKKAKAWMKRMRNLIQLNEIRQKVGI